MAGKREPSVTEEEADKTNNELKTRQTSTGKDLDSDDDDLPSRKIQKTAQNTEFTGVRQSQAIQSAECRATFDTAELFDEIILYLPDQDIIPCAWRVSKSWNDAISASSAIQKKLRRGPRLTEVTSPVGLSGSHNINKVYREKPYIYKALVSGVPMYSGSYQINSRFPDSPGQRYRHTFPDIPTLPVKVAPVWKYQLAPPQWQQHVLAHMVQILMTRDQPLEGRSETPTWLGEHLAEPPISTAWIEVFAEVHVTRARSARSRLGEAYPLVLAPVRATVRDTNGVTFGLVRDAVDKIMAQPAYEHFAREKRPVTIRICFVVDRADVPYSEPPKDKRGGLNHLS